MKKTLFILTALAAASAGVQAQSSVTLSGTVDLAAQHMKRGDNGSITRMVSGANATSKLIFRGVEDLGGGMYANFWLEAGIDADSGTGNATNTNNQPSGTSTATAGTQGLTFGRRAIVGLGGGWGEVQMGRNWNANYDTFTGKFDPFAISIGIGIHYDASTNRDVLRVSNDLAYITPRFAGFQGQLHHFRGENAPGAGTSKDGNGYGVRLQYDQGPLAATAHYVRQNFDAGDGVYRGIAVAYDFSVVKVAGTYVKDDRPANGTPSAGDQTGWLVGLWVPLGAGEIKASYSTTRIDSATTDPRARKIVIGYVHNLSKRTALYATAAQTRNRNGGTFGVVTGSVGATGADQNATGYDIGIRHNF